MPNKMLFLSFLALVSVNSARAQAPFKPDDRIDIKSRGAFDFPQKDATVLCDTPQLRLSAFNDREYLFVQAVLWMDDNDELGETDDGRKIGDHSDLAISADPDGKGAAAKGRIYSLNPWPKLAGLHYSVEVGKNATTGLQGDSKGHGAISYLTAGDGKRLRVDTYLIPLSEIGRKPGAEIRFAFWGSSIKPALTLNSIGYESKKMYYSFSLPRKDFHTFKLADRPASIEITKVPEGRDTIKLAPKEKPKPMPKVGTVPPEVAAAKWINWKGEKPPTLKSLRGKLVVVEFWATWCGPCVAGIPHLNALHEKYADDGLVILSLTDQSAGPIGKFVKDKGMKFTVGAGSETIQAYGVSGIPHAFLIGRNDKLIWQGNPGDEAFDKTIAEVISKE